MKIASLAVIKKELQHLSERELIDLILEVSKFTTDNKRFVYFKLFGRDHPDFFKEMVMEELEEEFGKANLGHYHFAKKSAQAIRRKLNKFLKFTKEKSIQIELIAFFCEQLHTYGFLEFRHPVIDNLYQMQVNKIQKLVEGLHEDLQYDYQGLLEELEKRK